MVPRRLPVPKSRFINLKSWLVLTLVGTLFVCVIVLNHRDLINFSEERIAETNMRNSRVVKELISLLLTKQRIYKDDHVNGLNHTVLRMIYQGNEDRNELHLVFSMSCNQGRRVALQTVLQYSAVTVGQRGPITQILSGCTDTQREEIMREPTLYYDFRRHFTPSYSPNPLPNVTDDYVPYNKPFALRHFLQNAQPQIEQDVIALIDADMIFFKPLEVNTGRNMTKYYHGKRDLATVNDTVENGIAIAQDWHNYLRSGWYTERSRDKLEHICSGKPCMNVTPDEASEYYASTGPPYIMTKHDLLLMIDDYCDFVVRGRQVDNNWMVEMFAYALAAANHGIQHTLMTNLGVTHPKFAVDQHEHWDFIDKNLPNPCQDSSAVIIPLDPPVGIHYCQIYEFVQGDKRGHYYKYDLPETLVNCDSPLIKVPSASDWDSTTSELLGQKRHEVWAVCSITKIVNQAMIKYKQRKCPTGYNTTQSIELS